MTDYRSSYLSPLGEILLSSDGEALTGLWFAGQAFEGSTMSPSAEPADLPVFRQTRRWLEAYFSGGKLPEAPPVRLIGTAYRRPVWALLPSIPYGETLSYRGLAELYEKETGQATSPRAVGGAVGRNPISLILPCHRVVGSDGSLTGYAGGLRRKEWLLSWEQQSSRT